MRQSWLFLRRDLRKENENPVWPSVDTEEDRTSRSLASLQQARKLVIRTGIFIVIMLVYFFQTGQNVND
jgi:hypothetical protein